VDRIAHREFHHDAFRGVAFDPAARAVATPFDPTIRWLISSLSFDLHKDNSRRAGPMRANERNRAWIVVLLLFIFMVINFADKAVIGIEPLSRAA
jgi:hypothetical protein